MIIDKSARISLRTIVTLAVLATISVGAFLAVKNGMTENAETSAVGKVMQTSPEAPLDAKELDSVLSSAGIRVHRFRYSVPYKHNIVFRQAVYVNGKCVDDGMNGSSETQGLDAGKNSVMIITQAKDDEKSFTFSFRGGSVSRSVRLSEYGFPASGARTEGLLYKVRLANKKAVPIFVFAADQEGTHGFGETGRAEEIVTMYDIVIVVTAELQALEPVPQAARFSVKKRALDLYVGTPVADERMKVPVGYKLLKHRMAPATSVLVKEKPDLVVTIRKLEPPQHPKETVIGKPYVSYFEVEMNEQEARALSELTEKNIRKQRVIVMDGKLLGLPEVIESKHEGQILTISMRGMNGKQIKTLMKIVDESW